MKIHFHYPVFWTACNMASRELPEGTQLSITRAKAKVTCGNCKRTQGFFSREGLPEDEVFIRTVRDRGGLK